MSITDELRKYADRLSDEAARKSEHGFSPVAMALEAIADRIDAEHERELRETGEDIVRDVRREWVRLPLDANGVPIRVGDVLTDGEYTFVVDELATFGGGSWSIRSDDGNAWKACDVTHHHKPTVEDVLRDVVTLCHNTWKEESPFHFYDVDDVMKSGNIAEFASRLRLAEEGA